MLRWTAPSCEANASKHKAMSYARMKRERSLRIPTKPATHSNRKPATDSDLKPAGIPI